MPHFLKNINIIKALSDEGRLRVILTLFETPELCVCQIVEMLNLATATVSRHMSILQSAELVKSRKDGRWVYYKLDENFPTQLKIWLIEQFQQSDVIQKDRQQLISILCCDPNELCKTQKLRKE